MLADASPNSGFSWFGCSRGDGPGSARNPNPRLRRRSACQEWPPSTFLDDSQKARAVKHKSSKEVKDPRGGEGRVKAARGQEKVRLFLGAGGLRPPRRFMVPAGLRPASRLSVAPAGCARLAPNFKVGRPEHTRPSQGS